MSQNTSGGLSKHQQQCPLSQKHVGVVAEIDELPFSEHSVDACILSHCLEYHSDPHHILREAHRTLIPGGYIVISGFNPFSLCGLANCLPFSGQKLPWSGRFFTPARVKDWLDLLGFEILADERFIHASEDTRFECCDPLEFVATHVLTNQMLDRPDLLVPTYVFRAR